LIHSLCAICSGIRFNTSPIRAPVSSAIRIAKAADRSSFLGTQRLVRRGDLFGGEKHLPLVLRPTPHPVTWVVVDLPVMLQPRHERRQHRQRAVGLNRPGLGDPSMPQLDPVAVTPRGSPLPNSGTMRRSISRRYDLLLDPEQMFCAAMDHWPKDGLMSLLGEEVFMVPEELAKYRANRLAGAKAAQDKDEARKPAGNARINQQNAEAEAALQAQKFLGFDINNSLTILRSTVAALFSHSYGPP